MSRSSIRAGTRSCAPAPSRSTTSPGSTRPPPPSPSSPPPCCPSSATPRLDLDPAGIDVHAAFYDLGGDSLLLVRLARLMTRRFDRRVRVPDLFSFRDISSLARWLDEESGATPEVVQSARLRAGARRAALRGRAKSSGS
ncbi:acyl carrier protein [Streptomyces sp. NPDC005904]|uniref:acyl carrier protein n=1 Tax=Streptomyces sp. NPDC005904 TaxID=3154570 RepID=UPI00340F9A8A